MIKICRTCGKTYNKPPSINLLYCCNKCYPRRGSHNPKWRGGYLISDGYRYIFKPSHPNATQMGYVLEHRLVMEKVLKRYLLPNEVVHHINHNKIDNSPRNLMLLPSTGKHSSTYHTKRDKLGRFHKPKS